MKRKDEYDDNVYYQNYDREERLDKSINRRNLNTNICHGRPLAYYAETSSVAGGAILLGFSVIWIIMCLFMAYMSFDGFFVFAAIPLVFSFIGIALFIVGIKNIIAAKRCQRNGKRVAISYDEPGKVFYFYFYGKQNDVSVQVRDINTVRCNVRYSGGRNHTYVNSYYDILVDFQSFDGYRCIELKYVEGADQVVQEMLNIIDQVANRGQ